MSDLIVYDQSQRERRRRGSPIGQGRESGRTRTSRAEAHRDRSRPRLGLRSDYEAKRMLVPLCPLWSGWGVRVNRMARARHVDEFLPSLGDPANRPTRLEANVRRFLLVLPASLALVCSAD